MNTWLIGAMLAQWIVILALVVMNAVLFRQLGIIIMGSARGVEASGIPVGKKPPQDRLAALDGDWAPSDWSGQSYLIFFAGTYCSECAQLWPTLRQLHERGLQLVVMLFHNDPDESAAYVREHDVPGVVIPTDQETGHRFDAVAVPFAYVIDARGGVAAKGMAGGEARLAEFATLCGVPAEHAAAG
jgi:hypothetical protein